MSHSIGSVLVPTDGSDGSHAGARGGIDLANRFDAELHVLAVIDTHEVDPPLSSLDTDDRSEHEQSLMEWGTRAVESVVKLAQPHLTTEITTAVESGLAYRTITEYAERHGIDAIVMGTHGRTGLRRVLLGSVAEKTLRTASVPVMLVPPSADVDVDGVEDVSYGNVLLPTDGSKGAQIAVEWGILLAAETDATVQTVYSIDTSRLPDADEVKALYEAFERTGQNALETVRESAREAGVNVAANVSSGPAARVILRYIDEYDIDLIVMGTHGRSGVERYLTGSVTEEVVRNSNVPVWCVPMTDIEPS